MHSCSRQALPSHPHLPPLLQRMSAESAPGEDVSIAIDNSTGTPQTQELPLADQSASTCASKGGKPVALKPEEIERYMQQLGANWALDTLDGVQVLKCKYNAKNFAAVCT